VNECETWSLTIRIEPRLSIFENRMLRGTLGPKRDEIMEGWRILHNEEIIISTLRQIQLE
jgi:hypothetical protein